jgi:serine/threonine protein kinase
MLSWARVKEVLGLALDQPPERRSALLDALCAGEPELRAEVESLLNAESSAGAFIEVPAVGVLDSFEEADPQIGRHVGPYVIEQRIGSGGMGAVYLARRTGGDFEQLVAIKMIRRGMDSELVVRRFRHERQILASLNHPNIARLFDGGTTSDGLPYFVMEYVAGTPIDRYADDHRLNTAQRLQLCLPVLDAVRHAHQRQIVHRDLKPGNVLVSGDGQPKLLDFGIAKILDPDSAGDSTMTTLARPMTPDYASPEQILGLPITPATDVYALGLLLYELLTGHRPFRFTTGTPEEISSVVCEQEPERPSTAIARTETTMRADRQRDA